jgi:hypothetical protein
VTKELPKIPNIMTQQHLPISKFARGGFWAHWGLRRNPAQSGYLRKKIFGRRPKQDWRYNL